MMQQQRRRQKSRKNVMSCNNNNVVVQQHDAAGKDFRPCVSCTNQCYKVHGEIHKKAVQRRLEKQQLDQQQLKKYNNCSSNNSGVNITDHHLHHHHLQQGMSTSSCCSDQREVMINNEPYFVKPMIKGCMAYAQRSWMGIPLGFAENFPESMKNKTFTLEGPSGDLWTVELKNYTKNPCIYRGWRAFAYDHHLKEDDQLHFSLADATHFVVDIFNRDGNTKAGARDAVNSGFVAPLHASSLDKLYCSKRMSSNELVEVWNTSDDDDEEEEEEEEEENISDTSHDEPKSPPSWGDPYDCCKVPSSTKRLQQKSDDPGTQQGFSGKRKHQILGDDHGSHALCIELSSSNDDDDDDDEDDDEITHRSLHRSLSGSAQKKKRKIQGAGSDADLPQGLGHELGEADQYNDPVSQFTKMFQSCSQNAAKKSVTEKGSTPPAAAARAATCKLPAIRLFSTAPAGMTPSCKSGVMIAADDGVIKKEIMNPGGGSSSSAAATNRKCSYSCVLVSKRGPVTEVERDKALNAATEFADNCKNPYYLVVLKASQAYKSFELDLPLEFVADPEMLQDLHERRLSITLVDAISAKPWEAHLWLEMPPKKPRLSFMGFARSHYLEEGDVCVFELTDNVEFTLSVSLFRVLEVPLRVDEEATPDGWREHYEVYESMMQPI